MSECPACGYDLDVEAIESWEFTLDHRAQSGNAIGSSGRGSKGWKYRNERKKVARVVGVLTGRTGDGMLPTQATKKRRLWITRLWGKGQRAYDSDNLAWGLKPLVDEIKFQGWIKEDSPKWVERIYKQCKNPSGENQILIRIEELDV